MAQESLKLLKERRKVEQDIAKLKKETKDWGDQELRQLQELENRKKRIAKFEGKAAADRDKAELAYLGVASRVSTLQEDIGKRVEKNGRSVFQLSNAFKIAASNMQPMVRGGVKMKDTYTGFASLMDDVAMNAEKAEKYLQGGSENMESTTSSMSSKIEELSQNAEGYFTAKSGEQFKIDPSVQKEAQGLLEVYTGLDSRFKEATTTMGEGFNNINDLQSQSVGLAGEMALSYGKIGTSGFSVSVDKANELYDTSVKQAKLIKSVTLPDMKKKIKFMLKELALINPLSDEYVAMQSSIEEMQGDMEEMDAAAESMVDTAERNLKAADQMRIMNNQIAASSELILGPFNKLKGAMEALPFGGLVSSLVDLEGVGNKFGDTVQKNLLGMFSEPTVAMEAFALKSDKAGEKTGKRFRDLSTGQLVAGDDEAVLTLNDGMTTFTNIMDSAKEAVGAMGEGLNKLTGMPVAMAGPLLVVVGIILLAAKVAQIFFGGMMDTRKELGVTVAEAGKLQSAINTTALEFSFLGVSAEDVAGVSDSIRNNMGGIAAASQENVSALTQMTALYGISGENTGFLATQMKAVGASSVEAATAQMESVALLARANGVAPGPIMNDVAEASEAFAGYAKDGGENVFKAAIAAKKLGLGMAEVEAISDSLLDFESSINAEMEASMLLGRSVNMDKAREAALNGDLETQMREVTKQVGSQAEWERLNVVQRKALAAAAGIEVSAMAKMVANQEELNNMSSAEKAHRDYMAKVMEMLGKAWAGFLSIGKALLPVVIGIGVAVALAFYPVTLAIIAVTAIGAAFNYLNKQVPVLGTVLGVVLGLITAIWVKSKLAGGEMSGGMMEGAKSMASGLKDKLSGLGGAGDAAKEKGGGLLSGLKDKLTGGGTPTKADGTPDKRFGKRDKTKSVKKPKAGKKGGKGPLGGMFEKFDAKKALAGAAALLIIAAALWVTAKALQEFAAVSWGDMAKAGVALLGLVITLGIIGAIMMSGVGAVAILAGAAAMLIIAASLLVLGIAIQAIAKGMTFLVELIPLLTKNLMAIVPVVPALFVFSVALGLMGIGFMAMAAGLLYMTPMLPTLFILTGLLLGIAVASKLMSSSIVSMTEPLVQLATIAGPLLLLAGSFTALGASMAVMALGALAMIPALPILFALKAMGLIGGVSLGGGGEEAEAGGGESNPVELKLEETNAKLDRLISLMGTGGVIADQLKGINSNTGQFVDIAVTG